MKLLLSIIFSFVSTVLFAQQMQTINRSFTKPCWENLSFEPQPQIQIIDRTWINTLRNSAKENDTLYIINFWATWCKPCVEELPCFENVTATHKNEKVKVLLVSNDMKKELNGRLTKFVSDKNLQSQVLFMNETNPNDWLETVNKDWSGAIPATWFVRGNKEFFHEGELTCEELEKMIREFLSNKDIRKSDCNYVDSSVYNIDKIIQEQKEELKDENIRNNFKTLIDQKIDFLNNAKNNTKALFPYSNVDSVVYIGYEQNDGLTLHRKQKFVTVFCKEKVIALVNLINNPNNFGYGECGTQITEAEILFFYEGKKTSEIIFSCGHGQIICKPENILTNFGGLNESGNRILDEIAPWK